MTSQNTTATGSALDDLPEALRHPHVTRFTIEPHPYRPSSHQVKYEYKPFTGTEDRPERPAGLYDLDLTPVQYEAVTDLYNALLGAWSRAGFTAAVRDYLPDADAAWQTWTATEQALTEAYGAFDGLTDGKWKAGRMALTDLQNTLLKAAADFDSAAAALARLQEAHWHDMWKSMGEWNGDAQTTNYHDIATEMGISTDGWQISDADTYKSSWTPPLTSRTQKTVAEQTQRLDRAAKDITDAGDGVLQLVDGIRTELDTVRAERDQAAAAHRAETERMQERIGDLTDDVKDRAYERDIAVRQRDEARAELADDAKHADCAWVADLEAAKAASTKATAERDQARKDLKDANEKLQSLRRQRIVFFVIDTVLVIGLAFAFAFVFASLTSLG